MKWLLNGLQRRGCPMEDVFVPAPFRAMATQVGRITRRFGMSFKRSGSVHTSQGRKPAW